MEDVVGFVIHSTRWSALRRDRAYVADRGAHAGGSQRKQFMRGSPSCRSLFGEFIEGAAEFQVGSGSEPVRQFRMDIHRIGEPRSPGRVTTVAHSFSPPQ